MDDPGSIVLVAAISSVASAIVSIVLFLSLLMVMSWNISTPESPGFKLRTLIASQLIFWGSLAFVIITDPPSAEEFMGNGISFLLNLVLIVYATGIGMRAAMRIRNMIAAHQIDPTDLTELERKLKIGEKARDIASRIDDNLR